MNNCSGKDDQSTGAEQVEDRYLDYLIDQYQPVFLRREGVVRVLGEGHPVAKVLTNAVASLDTEELEVAHAAYMALPEWVIHRIENPWVGHPPPQGTRQKLRSEHAPELVGESGGREPVGCYLQIGLPPAHRRATCGVGRVASRL